MSSNVNASGVVRVLDRPAGDAPPFDEREIKDAQTLARILLGIVRDVARALSGWRPNRTDFEGMVVDATGTTTYRLKHDFGGLVRYWPVEWVGAAAPNLCRHTSSDATTLVLTSTSAGVATIRVEVAG